ncbi:hypothetical protein ANCDUO_03209 [Ancylostoma duodenale]|uniref:FCH domain-containing protein n=1 Tax=Ancylostoma duodenale TaxID=51022 RepID=A0A0C2D9N4_9BILA|nr:hypothetical protein ANCDUO_03209 [Ancylostoma duodenale]
MWKWKEIRAQLNEQIRCIGERTETQIAVLQEVDDFFRKRGEAEAEYSRQLEKLAKGIMQRHKAEKNRKSFLDQYWTKRCSYDPCCIKCHVVADAGDE